MKYYVPVSTRDEAKELLNILEKNGYGWLYEREKKFFDCHEQNTCLVFYPNRKEIFYGETLFI